MKFKEKALRWVKEVLIYLPIVLVIGGVVLLTKVRGFEIVVPFIVIDCGVGYIYRNKIISMKNTCLIKSLMNKEETLEFNSDYYDLYQEFNYNRMITILRSLTVALILTPILFGWIKDLGTYVTVGMILMVLSLLIISIVLFSGKRDNIIMSLISIRKEEWFGKYTEKELEILSQLCEVDSNKRNERKWKKE